MSERYNLPAGTAVLVNDHIARCKNLALILDKYPPQTVVADTKNKGPWLQSLVKGNHIDAALARSAYKRWHSMMSAMLATFFDASLDWRMVVGLGGESVLETDITLHHLYGIPFIPASALKGLTRAYVTGEVEGYKSEKEENDNKEVKRIFGSQERAGSVIFFDALPVDGKATFVLDIMNPHYSEYYRGTKPPTNDQNPIPVTFLAVTNTTFTFALAPRTASSPEQRKQHEEDVKKVRLWLLEALQQYGVGGKTSAGYGYFQKEAGQGLASTSLQTGASPTNTQNTQLRKISPPPPPVIDPEIQLAESYKTQLERLKESDVAGQIYSYYQRWQQLTSQETRILLAQAIIETVRRAGRERVSAERPWYKELQAFLSDR